MVGELVRLIITIREPTMMVFVYFISIEISFKMILILAILDIQCFSDYHKLTCVSVLKLNSLFFNATNNVCSF